MYNLHSHSLLSDGCLLPSEVAMRYLALGYKAIAITDHVDYSNIESTVRAVLEFVKHWPKDAKIKVFSGIELTHLPLNQFKPLAKYARDKGVEIIVAHGETLVEPVVKGTNRAALEADIDILAHPGLISDEEVKLARGKNIFLEVTSRHGHASTNAHVVERALELKAKLILNTDSHAPEDIISPEELKKIGTKAGITKKDLEKIYQDTNKFLSKKGGKMKMRNLAVLLLCLAVFIFSGCATNSRGKESGAAVLESQPLLKFSDVPVPMGFRSTPNGSYSFECSNVRVGVLKYQGKADAEQVVNFYKEQMPMYNWFLLNAVEYGDRILNFDRENETCIINLQPKGNNVNITISLGPKSQALPKKAKKPIK